MTHDSWKESSRLKESWLMTLAKSHHGWVMSRDSWLLKRVITVETWLIAVTVLYPSVKIWCFDERTQSELLTPEWTSQSISVSLYSPLPLCQNLVLRWTCRNWAADTRVTHLSIVEHSATTQALWRTVPRLGQFRCPSGAGPPMARLLKTRSNMRSRHEAGIRFSHTNSFVGTWHRSPHECRFCSPSISSWLSHPQRRWHLSSSSTGKSSCKLVCCQWLCTQWYFHWPRYRYSWGGWQSFVGF